MNDGTQWFVVHLFVPLDESAAGEHAEIRRLWSVGTQDFAPGVARAGRPSPAALVDDLSAAPAGTVIADARGVTAGMHCRIVVRRLADVVSFSVRMDGLGWAEFEQYWQQLRAPGPEVLGEYRLFLTRAEVVAGSTRPESPRPEPAAPDEVGLGLRVWDAGRNGLSSARRDLVVAGSPDQGDLLDQLTWSDDERTPTLADYLLTTAKIRYRYRSLRDWQGSHPRGLDVSPPPFTDAPGLRTGRGDQLDTWMDDVVAWEAALIDVTAVLAGMRHAAVTSLERLHTQRHELAVREHGWDGIFFLDLAAAAVLPGWIDGELDQLERDRRAVGEARIAATGPYRTDRPLGSTGRPAQGQARSGTRVFIVYGHDSPNHQKRVLGLAAFLRRQGIDVEIDRYVQGVRQSWPRWAEHEITRASFVLVIASPLCRQVLQEDFPSNRNHGLYKELSLLENLQQRDWRSWSRRILPVILKPYGLDDIPLFLNPSTWDHYPVTELTESGAESLLDTIRGVVRYPRPPLGEPESSQL